MTDFSAALQDFAPQPAPPVPIAGAPPSPAVPEAPTGFAAAMADLTGLSPKRPSLEFTMAEPGKEVSRGSVASLGQSIIDKLTAGAQGASPFVTPGQSQLAPPSEQVLGTDNPRFDQTKYVALRDPGTGKMALYLRTPAQNEGWFTRGANTIGSLLGLAIPEGGIPFVGRAPIPTASQGLLQDFTTSGVTPSIPAVGQGIASRLATNIMSKLPIVGGPVGTSARQSMADTGAAAERLASGFGTAANAEEAGGALQTGVPDFVGRFNKASSGLYKQSEALIPPETRVPLENTLAALRGPADRFVSTPRLGEAITNPRLQTFHDILTEQPEGGAAAAAPRAPQVPQKPQDIVSYLISRGGVQDDRGELAAMDMHRVGPGYFGRLASSKGMPLDQARQSAIDAGYLHPDSDINDLLTAVYDTTHGAPVYNPGDPMTVEWLAHQRQMAQEQDIPFFGENPPPMATAQKIQTGQAIPFSELSEFRSYIGRMLGEPTLINNIPRADLKRVYGGISQDLGNAATAAGPEAAAAFSRANEFYKSGIARIDQLEPLLSGSPEQSFAAINRAAGSGPAANAGLLREVQRSLTPEQWGDIGSAVIRRLGEPTPGTKDMLHGAEGGFSASSFATNWNKLSPAAKDSLFGASAPGSNREALDALVRVADAQKQVMKFANPSGTASHMMGAGAAGLIAEHFFDLTHHPIATTLGLLGSYGASKALMAPGFARWLYGISTSGATHPVAAGIGNALAQLDQASQLNPGLAPYAAQLRARLGQQQQLAPAAP